MSRKCENCGYTCHDDEDTMCPVCDDRLRNYDDGYGDDDTDYDDARIREMAEVVPNA